MTEIMKKQHTFKYFFASLHLLLGKRNRWSSFVPQCCAVIKNALQRGVRNKEEEKNKAFSFISFFLIPFPSFCSSSTQQGKTPLLNHGLRMAFGHPGDEIIAKNKNPRITGNRAALDPRQPKNTTCYFVGHLILLLPTVCCCGRSDRRKKRTLLHVYYSQMIFFCHTDNKLTLW